jgi:hypothetical protein
MTTATTTRTIVARQQDKAGWVPVGAWYIVDEETGECFGWHWDREEVESWIPMYEQW